MSHSHEQERQAMESKLIGVQNILDRITQERDKLHSTLDERDRELEKGAKKLEGVLRELARKDYDC